MHGRWQRDASDAAAALRRATARAGLVAVPLHDALRDQGWTAMLTQFAADWFHPNDRGHRVWADAFWTAITSDSDARETPAAQVVGALLAWVNRKCSMASRSRSSSAG